RHRRRWWGDASVRLAIPMPALLGPRIVSDDSFHTLPAGGRAVVEAAPVRLARSPREALRLQLAEERVERVVRLADRAVLADEVRHTRIDEQPRPIAVVAGDVAEVIDVAALRATDRSGARGVGLMADSD